ncbi:hypothetical protein LXL04_020378 [Taraxacum kok-saghyz]
MQRKHSLGRPDGGGTSGHRTTTNHYRDGWEWRFKSDKQDSNVNKGEYWRFKDTTSFFISNLPDVWIGTLIDLFVVNWRDKYGNRFGFCRLNRVENEAKVIDNLNKLIIGGKKLFARLARFDRKNKGENVQKKEGNRNLIQIHKAYIPPSFNNTRSNMSYKEACEGADMITPVSEEDKNKFLNNGNIKSWFKSLKIWEDNFKIDKRIAWVNVEGIPIKYWSLEVLVQIARDWGEVVITDLCQFGGANVAQSKVCIRTKMTNHIMGSKWCKIDIETFQIRFMEDGNQSAMEIIFTEKDEGNFKLSH